MHDAYDLWASIQTRQSFHLVVGLYKHPRFRRLLVGQVDPFVLRLEVQLAVLNDIVWCESVLRFDVAIGDTCLDRRDHRAPDLV